VKIWQTKAKIKIEHLELDIGFYGLYLKKMRERELWSKKAGRASFKLTTSSGTRRYYIVYTLTITGLNFFHYIKHVKSYAYTFLYLFLM